MSTQMREFERDTILAAELQRLITKHQCRSVVETGTEYCGSANAFGRMVPNVYTCDLTQKFGTHDIARNVLFWLGDSRNVLPRMILRATPPVLFFLDAHTSNPTDECPLLDEVAIIARHYKGLPVIVVHDCQVPDHPEFGYDVYRDKPISLALVSEGLDKVYPKGWDHHYNERAEGAMRGCLFIEPIYDHHRIPKQKSPRKSRR